MQHGDIPDTEQKTKDIRLLLLVQLANVLIRTHPVVVRSALVLRHLYLLRSIHPLVEI